jgi:hypothetical protein
MPERDLIAEGRRKLGDLEQSHLSHADRDFYFTEWAREWMPAALAALEAARRVIQDDAELEALPVEALIVDKWGTVWQRRAHGWALIAVKRSDAPTRIVLPAVVMWEPAQEATP